MSFMNLRLITIELKTDKTGLNLERGRVRVIYGGKLPWQESLERVFVRDTRLGHIRTGS
jgi:hypothetical protein